MNKKTKFSSKITDTSGDSIKKSPSSRSRKQNNFKIMIKGNQNSNEGKSVERFPLKIKEPY